MGRFNIFDSDSIVEGEKRRFPWWALLLCLAAGMLADWLLRNYCYMGGESEPLVRGTDTCHRLRDEAHGDCRERSAASDRRGARYGRYEGT